MSKRACKNNNKNEHNIDVSGMKRLDAEYTLQERIGTGTYGTVSFAEHKMTKQKVAVKTFKPGKYLDVYGKREIDCLQRLAGHDNIIRVLQICTDHNRGIHMVMECAHHDLRGLLNEINVVFGMSAGQLKGYFQQLMQGLSFCHHNKIAHRDLKPENILLTMDGHLKLADFGMARELNSNSEFKKYTNPVTTQWYRAPELYLSRSLTVDSCLSEYDFAIDIWSAGCILGELIMGAILIRGKTFTKDAESDASQMETIWKMCGTPTVSQWPIEMQDNVRRSFKHKINRDITHSLGQFVMLERKHIATKEALILLDKMLQLLPGQRPTAKDVLQCDYLLKEKDTPYKPSEMIKYTTSRFTGSK